MRIKLIPIKKLKLNLGFKNTKKITSHKTLKLFIVILKDIITMIYLVAYFFNISFSFLLIIYNKLKVVNN